MADISETFRRDGFLVLRNFYDVRTELEPIQRAIYEIIRLVIEDHQLPIERPSFHPGSFDFGYQEIIRIDRRLGGVIYDAAKQLPAFLRLVASEKHEQLVSTLRQTALAGVAGAGSGIRIDNPSEDQYATIWHQDYPYHLRSADGIVFWSPLVKLTNDMGLLSLCPGSHALGPLKLRLRDPALDVDSKSYTLLSNNFAIIDIDEVTTKYKPREIEVDVGDLLAFDFQLVHRSGMNRSTRSRWTMQMRLFNFLEPVGRRIGWIGSFGSGKDFRAVHPELFDPTL